MTTRPSPFAARALGALAVLASVVASCGGDDGDTATTSDGATTGEATAAGDRVTLLAYDSFVLSDGVLEAFTERTGIEVEVATGGDAGELVARAVLTKGDPEADVLWGVDNTLLSRAVDEGIFEPYQSPELAAVPDDLVALVPGHDATPVDYGDVCVNADDRWFSERGLTVPATLDDLADPAYADLLVVPDPATSSPGLAFLLATVAAYGEDGWGAYWGRLRDNGVEVVDGWTEAYTVRFSGSSGAGPKPLVVSYGSSPPAEVVFADPPVDAPPTSVLTGTCFRQVEFAGVLAGTEHRDAARRLVDHLLSREVQEDLPLSMFVYPARTDAALPEVFTQWAVQPDEPLTLPPEDIAANRARWVDEWTTIVLR
jgi:thiamine transport system substrate-binding protein